MVDCAAPPSPPPSKPDDNLCFQRIVPADLARAYIHAMRPPASMSPSQWAERYRVLAEGTTERPGKWDNEYFPYLSGVMDSVEHAIRDGKHGWCMMKSAQGGGSEAMLNVWGWLQERYPAPILYLISKDEMGTEFGRDRIGPMIDRCEVLNRKRVRPGGREATTIKRFTDGKLVIRGGQSVLNLQSQPYRFVLIDEVDSLLDEIKNSGDPVKIAEMRMNAFAGDKLICVFAHPSVRERGAAKHYYEQSDQRRGFVSCVHCGESQWLQWQHVKVVAPDGLNQAQAEVDPRCYRYVCPGCGCEITDHDRVRMIRAGVQYRSTLDAETAKRRPWVGVHFSVLYMPNWTIAALARQWIECRDDDARKRVFFNKLLGEPYETGVTHAKMDDYYRLIVRGRDDQDPDAWDLGRVPRGVRFLTAGQDSRSSELHWAIWGWGPVKGADGFNRLCGWLIDYGVHPREKSQSLDAADLAVVFDSEVYARRFQSTYDPGRWYHVMACAHDAGWNSEAVATYCRRWPGRAFPCSGVIRRGQAREDAQSNDPLFRWGSPLAYQKNGSVIKDIISRPIHFNTFALKMDWFSWIRRDQDIVVPDTPLKFVRLRLPRDVGDDILGQLCAEELQLRKRGSREQLVWVAKGANHWLDCTIYAFGLARHDGPFQRNLTFEEAEAVAVASGTQPSRHGVPSERPVCRKY